MQETLGRILTDAAKRDLRFLLIGGNAVILYGHPRNTIDLDLLIPQSKRSAWLDLFRDLGFRLHHGTDAFVQMEPASEDAPPVDLMLVDHRTWELLSAGAEQRELLGHRVALPRPEHLVALKLHATRAATRGKPETDWEDIRQLIRLQKLDWRDAGFQELIVRFGGEAALERIKSFDDEPAAS